MSNKNQTLKNSLLSGFLLLLASIVIFAISQAIELLLESYELTSVYISFCAGFILFTPLVSLALHPLLSVNAELDNKIKAQGLIVNIGLVTVVQGLFFLIWMTDAIAIYSIYVDGNSFLAKAFNINSKKVEDFSQTFYWINILLAWLFSFLSLAIGLLPCLIARLKNLGVVGNFVSAVKFAKQYKLTLAIFSFCLALSVVMPLMYANSLFILMFPITLSLIFIALTKRYLQYYQASILPIE